MVTFCLRDTLLYIMVYIICICIYTYTPLMLCTS